MGSALSSFLRISCFVCLLTTLPGGCHLVFPFEISPDSQVDRSDLAPPGDADRPDLGADAPITVTDASSDGPTTVTDGGPVTEGAPAPDTTPGPDAPLPDTVPWPDAPQPDTVPPPDTVSAPDGVVPPPPQLVKPCVNLTQINSTAKDEGPHLSTDGLRLYFSSERSGGPGNSNIWWAKRSSLGAPFNPPQLLASVNKSGSDQGDATLDKYELVILFERLEKGNKEIYEAKRTDRFIPFDPPVLVQSLATKDDDEDPSISPDGLTVVFSSNRTGGLGDNDLYIATRASRIVAFGNITPLVTVNSSDKDADPSFGGPHYLVFDSHRGGLSTPDLFIAVRTGWGAPFSAPVPISSLNTPANLEGDPFLEPNVKRFLYEGQNGTDTDIYECTYP